jgi:hypothetical protein
MTTDPNAYPAQRDAYILHAYNQHVNILLLFQPAIHSSEAHSLSHSPSCYPLLGTILSGSSSLLAGAAPGGNGDAVPSFSASFGITEPSVGPAPNWSFKLPIDELTGNSVFFSELPSPSAAHAGVSGASGVSSSAVGETTRSPSAVPSAPPFASRSRSGDSEAEWPEGERSEAAMLVAVTGPGKCVSEVWRLGRGRGGSTGGTFPVDPVAGKCSEAGGACVWEPGWMGNE